MEERNRVKQKKKILIIGGPDVHLRIDLINELRSSFNFECVGSELNIKSKFLSADIKYYYYPLRLGLNLYRDVVSLYHLIKIINQSSPDIVQTFDTKPNIYGRLAAFICNVDVIIGTQPGVGMVFSSYNPVFGKHRRRLFQFLLKIISKISDLTIFQNASDIALMKSKKIVNEKNSKLIISSGVDTSFYKNSNNLNFKSITGSRKQVRVTFIARLTISKGIIFFCELAQKVRRKNPNITFDVVGGIPEGSKDKISKEVLNQYESDINYLGMVENIKEILKSTDLIVFPSFYTEGVPRVLMEAASMGLPIIAFDNPGSDEVVINNYNGYLVAVGDSKSLENALYEILKNEKKYYFFSKNSRRLALQKFDISFVAKQYEKVYDSFNTHK